MEIGGFDSSQAEGMGQQMVQNCQFAQGEDRHECQKLLVSDYFDCLN